MTVKGKDQRRGLLFGSSRSVKQEVTPETAYLDLPWRGFSGKGEERESKEKKEPEHGAEQRRNPPPSCDTDLRI
jgi:hypothetical protein